MAKLLTFISLIFLFIASGDARKGNAAYERGEYAVADSLYRLALEEDPENAQLHFNLGNALAKQGKIEEAIESYLLTKEYASSSEEIALAEYNIGSLMAEKEEWKPAAHHFKSALKMDPSDIDSKHNYELAMLKSKQDEQEQQQQQQNQEQEEPTEYAKAMKKRAEELVDQQRYQEAYDLMQQALSVDETVQNFNDFIERINNIVQIEN